VFYECVSLPHFHISLVFWVSELLSPDPVAVEGDETSPCNVCCYVSGVAVPCTAVVMP
jgi:hypothetical protein